MKCAIILEGLLRFDLGTEPNKMKSCKMFRFEYGIYILFWLIFSLTLLKGFGIELKNSIYIKTNSPTMRIIWISPFLL
jgi:hypothetical protein